MPVLKVMTIVDYESLDLHRFDNDEKTYLYNTIMCKLVGSVIISNINPLFIHDYKNDVYESMMNDRMDTYFTEEIVNNTTSNVLLNISEELSSSNYSFGKLHNYNIIGTDNLCIISTIILGDSK